MHIYRWRKHSSLANTDLDEGNAVHRHALLQPLLQVEVLAPRGQRGQLQRKRKRRRLQNIRQCLQLLCAVKNKS